MFPNSSRAKNSMPIWRAVWKRRVRSSPSRLVSSLNTRISSHMTMTDSSCLLNIRISISIITSISISTLKTNIWISWTITLWSKMTDMIGIWYIIVESALDNVLLLFLNEVIEFVLSQLDRRVIILFRKVLYTFGWIQWPLAVFRLLELLDFLRQCHVFHFKK